jgi:hypothetical protein
MAFSTVTSYSGEVRGYPRESYRRLGFSNAGFVGTRQIRVNWADRYLWRDFFFGTQTANQYPYTVSLGLATNTVITSMDIVPDTTAKQTHGPVHKAQAQYIYAIIEMKYETCYYSGALARIEQIQATTSASGITGNFFFFDDTPISYVPLKWGGLLLEVTYPRVSTIPGIVLSLEGCVNAAPFVSRMYPGLTFNTGTLLCETVMMAPLFDTTVGQCFSLAYYLHYRPFDWNYELNPKTGLFEQIGLNGAPVYRYPYTSFAGV